MCSQKYLFIAFPLLFFGCSLAGKIGYLQMENSPRWCANVYYQAFSEPAKISSFRFDTDSLTVTIHTDHVGNMGTWQPQSLYKQTLLFGPPIFALVPNPFFFLQYIIPERSRYYIWCEFQSRTTPILVDPDKVHFFRLDNEPIIPKEKLIWRKDYFRSASYKWKTDSVATQALISNDTIAVSFGFNFTQEEVKGFKVNFQDFSETIPVLSTSLTSEWFYVPFKWPTH